ncbi:dnaJ [Scenedesmus sp. PABB004]|nr:dnaJ [Scenedesmus sp. PABB004]
MLAQRSAPARPRAFGRRLLRLDVAADASARVRGDARRVQRWLADARHWTLFYPGTKSVVRLGSAADPVRVGVKFEMQREMLGLSFPMSYEVLEVEPGKRLVLSGLSEHHTQMDQFFFMQDRHDAGFCAVRYIATIQLREWKRYLQPLATRYMAKVPEEAMSNLQRALNVAASPVFAPEFEQALRAEAKNSGGSRASSTPASRAGSAPGSRAGTVSGGGSAKGGWLRDMFSSASRSSRDSASSSLATSSGDDEGGGGAGLDPMGYYSLLGLSPAAQLDDEAIKSAYRRLAMQLHPDRQLGKDARAREAAAAEFAALLKAYEVLKDAETRALYTSGQLMEASLNL